MADLKSADLSNPEKEGYLHKRSAWMKEWRKRYFILKGSVLYFAKNTNAVPHGKINLKECLTVKSAEDKVNKSFAFQAQTAEDTFFMYADTEKEKDEWIGAIGKAIVRSSTAYDNDDDEDDDSDEDEE